MNREKLVPVLNLCDFYDVELSFIDNLSHAGLIELIQVDENRYIHTNSIHQIERIIRIHNDLHINIEGIDVVFNLLEKVDRLQSEIIELKSRLGIYE